MMPCVTNTVTEFLHHSCFATMNTVSTNKPISWEMMDPETFLNERAVCWTLAQDRNTFSFWNLFVTDPLILLFNLLSFHENEGVESYTVSNSFYPLSFQAILEWGCILESSTSHRGRTSALNFLLSPGTAVCSSLCWECKAPINNPCLKDLLEPDSVHTSLM